MESLRQMDPTDPRHKAVPHPYCNAYCLDDTRSFGYPCHVFQVLSRKDGQLYCLRRFDGCSKAVNPKIAASIVDQWAGMEHAGLVTMHHCFVAQRATFFVHQYIPNAMRLRDRLMMVNHQNQNQNGGGQQQQQQQQTSFSEPMMWSAICQLVATIRRIHQAHLALRVLEL
jgi:PAB-dependent poly(A)-specific ribonuclease subunit 3